MKNNNCTLCKHFHKYPMANSCDFGKLPEDLGRLLPSCDFIEKALLTCSNFDAKVVERDDFKGLYQEELPTYEEVYE